MLKVSYENVVILLGQILLPELNFNTGPTRSEISSKLKTTNTFHKPPENWFRDNKHDFAKVNKPTSTTDATRVLTSCCLRFDFCVKTSQLNGLLRANFALMRFQQKTRSKQQQ